LLTSGVPGDDKVISSIMRPMVTMPLSDLCELIAGKHRAAVRAALTSMYAATVADESAAGLDPVAAAAAVAVSSGGTWSLAAALCCDTTASDNSSVGSSSCTTGLSCQVQSTAVVVGAAQHSPYKDSLMQDGLAKVSLVGMCWIGAAILGISLKLMMDDGCNFSNVGVDHLRDNIHHYLKPGSPARLVRLVNPVRVSLFAGHSKIEANYMLLDVPITIGRGVYSCNLLVVPQSNYGITLGNDFNWAYGAVRVSRDHHDRTTGRTVILPLNSSLLAPGSQLPSPPRNAGPGWRPKQYVPLHYEVTTEYWKVVPADGLPPKA
jgi:hypothetical protein